MPGRVVDTSVLAAFAFQEPNADEAAKLLEDAELYEPRLVTFELTNVAWKYTRLRQEPFDVIARQLAAVLGMEIRWVAVEPVSVLRLALETGLSAYAATYLAVCQATGAPLVTFDERLFTAAEKLGVQPLGLRKS